MFFAKSSLVKSALSKSALSKNNNSIRLSTISAVLTASLLTGCGLGDVEKAQQQLVAAQKAGDLIEQRKVINTLIEEDIRYKEDWRKELQKLDEVEILNEEAKKLLETDPFDALSYAAQSDQLIYNKQARKMVIDIIKPYKDFLLMYKPLREWAYPVFDKMVVPGTLAPGMSLWQEAANKPSLWPNNALVNLLTSHGREPTDFFYVLSNERRAFNEQLVLATRLSRDLPDDFRAQSHLENAEAVNAMYNTVISDLHHHLIAQGLQKAIEFNKLWKTKAEQSLASTEPSQVWITQYSIALEAFTKELQECCTEAQKELMTSFNFVERPNEYDAKVEALGKAYAQLLKDNNTPQNSPNDFIPHATKFNETMQAKLAELNVLANQIDRNDIATKFLHITYTWQNNSISDMERLVPYLKFYESSLRNY